MAGGGSGDIGALMQQLLQAAGTAPDTMQLQALQRLSKAGAIDMARQHDPYNSPRGRLGQRNMSPGLRYPKPYSSTEVQPPIEQAMRQPRQSAGPVTKGMPGGMPMARRRAYDPSDMRRRPPKGGAAPSTEEEIESVSNAMGEEMPSVEAVQAGVDREDWENDPAVNAVLDSWDRRKGQQPTEQDMIVRNSLPTDSIVEAFDDAFNSGRINAQQGTEPPREDDLMPGQTYEDIIRLIEAQDPSLRQRLGPMSPELADRIDRTKMRGPR